MNQLALINQSTKEKREGAGEAEARTNQGNARKSKEEIYSEGG